MVIGKVSKQEPEDARKVQRKLLRSRRSVKLIASSDSPTAPAARSVRRARAKWLLGDGFDGHIHSPPRARFEPAFN